MAVEYQHLNAIGQQAWALSFLCRIAETGVAFWRSKGHVQLVRKSINLAEQRMTSGVYNEPEEEIGYNGRRILRPSVGIADAKPIPMGKNESRMEGISTREKPHEVSQKVVLDPTPEVAVADYFKAICEESLMVRKQPEWDVPRMTPATELVAAKRDLAAAEQNLAKKRAEQDQKRKVMDKEWEELTQRELKLRESFTGFNKFIKENQEKRERAEQKIAEEKQLQAKRDEELETLQEKANYMKMIKEEMERHVNEYKIYENFLNQVIATSSELNSTYDILNRYETLVTARSELAARQERDLTALEAARREMVKLTEEKSQVMMGLNNELAELQIRYDRAKAMSLRWESAVSKIKNISAEKALELDQVRISCWNLYTALCARKNVEITVEPDNIEEQLVFIKRTVQESKRILRIVTKKAAKEVATSKVDVTTRTNA